MTYHWNSDNLRIPPITYPADGYNRPGVSALYFENEPYRGSPTKVFAWMGMPHLSEGQTCPAMVLLHGGGGTAFDEWVRIWNRRGYAAIAFDQCGCTPETPAAEDGIPHVRHADGGPACWDESFLHGSEPVAEQWQYHAVAAAARAHSLIASQPGVDPNRIGVTGISWGGYLTCLVAGMDPRYACAIPVYGCGFLGENSIWRETVFPNMDGKDVDAWLSLWDPSQYLPNATMPFCWVSGTNDFAYPLDSFSKSHRLVDRGSTLCIRVEMAHSHTDGWIPPEIAVFTDSVMRGGAPLPRITSSGSEDDIMWCEFDSSRPIMNAELNYTRAEGYWADRKYNVLPAEINAAASRTELAIPPFTTGCFINLFDDRGCVSSSDLIVLG